jgi:hypothetical protein
MKISRKPTPTGEVLLVYAFCMFRKRFLDELLKKDYDKSVWQEIGISEAAFDQAFDVVNEQQECFIILNRAIHAKLRRSGCPDPPCPNEGWLSNLVSQASKKSPLPRKVKKG